MSVRGKARLWKYTYGRAPMAARSERFTASALWPRSSAENVASVKSTFLIISDSFFPGWQAEIDGLPTKIYRTDYILRGVAVPSGKHTVSFIFKPRSLEIGKMISLAALVILAAICSGSLLIKAHSKRSRLS